MNSDNPSSYAGINKWQRMQVIISQHPTLLQANLVGQFKKKSVVRLLSENILVFLLQYTGLMISTLTLHHSPLWLASGTACAFVFMRGLSVLPGIWLGSLFAYLLEKMSFGLACGCATLFVLQAALLLWSSYRYISPTLIFYQKWIFIKFIFCSSLLTAMTSSGLAYFHSLALHHTTLSFSFWLQEWLANFNGLLIISCTLITWDAYFPQIDSLKRLNLVTLSLSYGLWLILIMTYLFSSDSSSIIWFALMTLPLNVLISARYGWCGTITAAFLLGILLTFATFFDAPLLSRGGSLIPLQFLLLTETLIGLWVTYLKPSSF